MTYSLTNVGVNVAYNDSQRVINITSNTITVNNSLFNINVTYNASKKSPSKSIYTGTGNETINNIVINFTKNLIYVNGTAVYNLTSSNCSVPKQANISPFSGTPDSDTNTTLFNLVTGDLWT